VRGSIDEPLVCSVLMTLLSSQLIWIVACIGIKHMYKAACMSPTCMNEVDVIYTICVTCV
jgi:hypothetical protein